MDHDLWIYYHLAVTGSLHDFFFTVMCQRFGKGRKNVRKFAYFSPRAHKCL